MPGRAVSRTLVTASCRPRRQRDQFLKKAPPPRDAGSSAMIIAPCEKFRENRSFAHRVM
jgi:hypothetical protein